LTKSTALALGHKKTLSTSMLTSLRNKKRLASEKIDKKQEIQKKHDEAMRKRDITNLHYRRIWDDELETNKDIFVE